MKDNEAFITIFVANKELQDVMNAVDLTDNSTKLFGKFKDIRYTTSTKIDDDYRKNLVRHLLEQENIGFVEFGDFFGFKSNLNTLSSGTNFIWVEDYKNNLKSIGMIEVEVDAN